MEMLKKNKFRWHLKARIIVVLMTFVSFSYISIFLIFNVFIHNYIFTNVNYQLSQAIKSVDSISEQNNNDMKTQEIPDNINLTGNKIGTRWKTFSINSDYSIADYFAGNDYNVLQSITSRLQVKEISIKSLRNYFLKAGQTEYYISSVADPIKKDAYLLFFVDITAINGLVRTINISLMIIAIITFFLCILVSNIISKSFTDPVKKLSKFSMDIGAGKFIKNDFSFWDIEFNDLANAMNMAAEKLKISERNKGIFFQNVSHELRTPLMAIRCSAEGIVCGIMDAEKSGNTIISETDRLSKLVDDLIYVSRIDMINEQIDKQFMDLRETIALSTSGLQMLADKNNIRFNFQFSDTPVLFLYNENYMYRVFTNLISNALRYAKSRVILSCNYHNGRIEVKITDDGAGILSEDLPFIFDRFYKGKDGQNGIGLSIVKSVVELHGGEISVHSEPRTCFRIVFNENNAIA